jgi:hypothetical protein
MQRLSGALLYVLCFGMARGGLFVAPIILANLLPAANYGILELAQALASVAATVLSLGTAATVPLVIVRKVQGAAWGSVLLHQVGVGSALGAVALILALAGAPPLAWLACLCTVSLMLQSLWSVVLKSRGRGEASLLLDAGLWGSLACAVLLAVALSISAADREDWVTATLLVYSAALAFWTLWRFMQASPREAPSGYAATVRTGLPLMVTTLLALLATTSGRIGIGLLSTAELTADYAVLFRATALPIIAHQIIIVARFRQVFEWPTEQLERKLPWVVALVAGSVVAFRALVDHLGWLLGPAFVSAFASHRVEGLLILAQCILWSAIALNDLVNTRSQIAGVVVRWAAVYFALALPLTWLWLSARVVDLAVFVPVHSLVMAGYFLTQALVMWRCGVRLHRIWALTVGAFVALSALAWMG